jgi:FtsH-binding integral membrane protein
MKVAMLVLLSIVLIGMIFIIMDEKRSATLRIGVFTLFSVVMGMSLSYVKKLQAKTVIMATVGTIVAFVVMAVIGYITAYKMIDLSPMGMLLLGSLVVMILTSIALRIAYPNERGTRKTSAIIFAVILSLYIMYDTNQILMNDIDYISGAFSYYIDIINLFKIMLEALSSDK